MSDARDRGGPPQPLLSVTGLTRHFRLRGGLLNRTRGTVHAVDDVSFTVGKGEVLGIVGESGCGKSTMARLLMHLIPADRGAILFDGELAGSPDLPVPVLRRQMQMVFQNSHGSLNPGLTVLQSLAFAPRMHGMARDAAEARSRDLLEQVGLAPGQFAGRMPHELSGGQRQRVNIARALALDPRLVILDEAVSALDKSVQAQILMLLVELRARFDLTYLFISHDLNVVEYLADRIMVMYLGQVIETGRVEDVYAAPLHPYTQALLASQPSLDPRRRTPAAPIAGDPPNPIDPPSGCRFRTRCALAEAMCAQAVPALSGEFGHLAACFAAQPGSGHKAAR